MTIQTWDPNRIGGGTIELIQDPTTGIFTTNEVGFVKLPDLTLPAIDQAAYDDTPDDGDPDDDTPDPCPDGYKLVDGVCQLIDTSDRDGDGGGGSGGGGYSGGSGDTYYDNRTQEMLEKAGGTYPEGYHSAEGGFEYTGTPPYLDIDRDTQPTPPGSGITMETLPSTNIQFAQEAYNKARINYDNLSNKFTKVSGGTAEDLKNLKIAEDQMKQADSIIQDYKMKYATSFPTTIKDAPIADFSRGPKPISTGKVPNYGISNQPTKGTLVGDQFFPDIITTPDLKGVKEVGGLLKKSVGGLLKKSTDAAINLAKDLEKKTIKIVTPGLVVARMGGAVLDTLFGVTDADRRRQTENKNALTSLNYKTRGELGSNIDPGRVAGNPATNVFAGMNMVSARGDIMQGARNRVSNLGKTIENLDKQWSGLKRTNPAAFNAKKARLEKKQDDFKKQLNEAQTKINQQAGDSNGSGSTGGGSTDGGSTGGGGSDPMGSGMDDFNW